MVCERRSSQNSRLVHLVLEQLSELLFDYLEGLVISVAFIEETFVLLDKVVDRVRRHHPIRALLAVKGVNCRHDLELGEGLEEFGHDLRVHKLAIVFAL